MIISRTPLRISFAGGGTDFASYYKKHEGIVISTTIDKYVYICVNTLLTGKVRVAYSQTELVSDAAQIKHNIIREALKITKIKDSVDITYLGDLMVGKEGTGLASSSALSVGVLHALYVLKDLKVTKETLALLACDLEIKKVKSPIGKQDQYSSAYGGLNSIIFHTDGSVTVKSINLTKQTNETIQENLLLLNTRIKRDSYKILSEQTLNTRHKINKRKTLDKMAEIAYAMKSALERNETDMFGELLHKNWLLKQTLADGITNPVINNWYKIARHNGALGGKICGAGGGGFLLLYAPKKKHKKILKALPELIPLDFSFESKGSTIVFNSSE